MSIKFNKDYAPVFVRWGAGIVFFLFGISQLINPENWLAWFPTLNFIEPLTLIFVNGIVDLIIGFLLLIGLLTRIIAFLAVLHLVGVIFTLGYNDIAIRDFGLLLASLSVLFHGPDKLCLDKRFRKSY